MKKMTLRGDKIRSLLIIILMCLFTSNSFSQTKINNPDITAKEILEHIKYLASDKLMGRFTGSEECYQAAEYIKGEFQSLGPGAGWVS